MKDISLEEKKKFLESKLTEEEIAEVFKRYAEQPTPITIPNKSSTQITSSNPVIERRLQQQSSILMSAVNVASIAILSSIGVNYFLDKVKDRQEKNLREEIKDRIDS